MAYKQTREEYKKIKITRRKDKIKISASNKNGAMKDPYTFRPDELTIDGHKFRLRNGSEVRMRNATIVWKMMGTSASAKRTVDIIL